MTIRSDVEGALKRKVEKDNLDTSLTKKIDEVNRANLVKNATLLGKEAGEVVGGFRSLESKVTTAGSIVDKGDAIVEFTEDVAGIGGVLDRTTAEVNLSTKELPPIAGLLDSANADGSILNMITGGDSAGLAAAFASSSTIEAIGGDLAGKIASIITLITGLGSILDGLSAKGIGGSGMDALTKTSETMSGKADSLLSSIDNAAGSLSDISNVSTLKEFTDTVNNISSNVTGVLNEVSAIQDINPVSDFTDNLLQDDGSSIGQLGSAYKDISSEVKGVASEVNGIVNKVNQTKAEVNAEINSVRSLVNQGKDFVGSVSTGGGSLQDISENSTGSASNTIRELTSATSLVGTGIKSSGSGGIGNSDISSVISQVQSGAPKDLAAAVQNVGSKNVGVDPEISKILSAQKGFRNTRELVERTVSQCKLQGIDAKKISEFEIIMNIVEIALSDIDTTLTKQIKVGDQDRSTWKESFDIQEYPRDFDTFIKFENGEINETTQSNIADTEKKPAVFQTCDTKEELQAEVRLVKRPIKQLIIHSTETFIDQYLTCQMLHEDHKARGFDTIQFHYVIRRDGTIQRGIPTTLISKVDPADFRNESINIALVGGIDAPTGTEVPNAFRSGNSFTGSQYKTLETFLDTFFKGYPGAKIYGIGELEGREEPYFNVGEFVRKKFGKVRIDITSTGTRLVN